MKHLNIESKEKLIMTKTYEQLQMQETKLLRLQNFLSKPSKKNPVMVAFYQSGHFYPFIEMWKKDHAIDMIIKSFEERIEKLYRRNFFERIINKKIKD